MATIHCHPADGTRPPAPPGAVLDAGKPRTGWASRSGLLEGALRSLLRYPLGCPTRHGGKHAGQHANQRENRAVTPLFSPLVVRVGGDHRAPGGPAPSTTSQVQLTADRCSWSRALKGWS